MNSYSSNLCRSLSGQQASQITSLLRPLVTPTFPVNHASSVELIGHEAHRIFAKRGLALISYAISAGISGAIWLGVFRTAEHFLK